MLVLLAEGSPLHSKLILVKTNIVTSSECGTNGFATKATFFFYPQEGNSWVKQGMIRRRKTSFAEYKRQHDTQTAENKRGRASREGSFTRTRNYETAKPQGVRTRAEVHVIRQTNTSFYIVAVAAVRRRANCAPRELQVAAAHRITPTPAGRA